MVFSSTVAVELVPFQARLALATVLREIGDHFIHHVIVRPVNQMASVAFLSHQAGMHQFLEMKGQSGRGNVHLRR